MLITVWVKYVENCAEYTVTGFEKHVVKCQRTWYLLFN